MVTYSERELTRAVSPLFFRPGEDGSPPSSPRQLSPLIIPQTTAKQLNRLWHSRLPEMGNMPSLSFGYEYSGIYYASAMWSNPVARALPQHEWLELRRFAIAPDAPRNTATWCLANMERYIKEHKPLIERLISYQDTEVHHGTIYKAANWTIGRISTGDDWVRNNRHRKASQTAAVKIRWEKSLL
jgi:hypothetical protein